VTLKAPDSYSHRPTRETTTVTGYIIRVCRLPACNVCSSDLQKVRSAATPNDTWAGKWGKWSLKAKFHYAIQLANRLS